MHRLTARESLFAVGGFVAGIIIVLLALGHYEIRLSSSGVLAVRLDRLTGELEWCTVEINPAKATFCYPERRP